MKKKLLLGVALVACGAMVLAGCGDPGNTTTSTSIGSGSTSSGPTLDVPLAEGVYNFQGADPTQKAELVAKMEQYAVDHHLAGIPLYDDAGYEMYSPRITLGSNTYIPNYGFGLLDGSLNTTGNMYNGSTAQANGLAYPDYFHSYNNLDSGTFNYWDSDGEDVSGRYGMVATSLFSVKMNDTNDGYVWRGELSKTDRPIMLDENGNEVEYHEGDTSRFWRVKVFTSEDESTPAGQGRHFRYAMSENATQTVPGSDQTFYEKYNNRGIQLEDYLTPYKAILDNGFRRAGEMVTEANGFYGASTYLYSAQKDWSEVGIQINEEEGSIDYTFITPQTQFYAMYNVSSSLYSPVPQEFLTDIGGASKYGLIGGTTDPAKNVSNVISTGMFVLDLWEQGVETVYSRNELYNRPTENHLKGYTERVYTGERYDEQVFQDFLAGKLDNATVPSARTSEYANNPRSFRTLGQTTLKINLNSTTEEQWEYFFGVNGTASQSTSIKDYWDVKPIMSNSNFLDGVFFAMNRQELAGAMGRNPALGYLGNAYMIDPEKEVSYRGSDAGKAVLQPFIDAAGNEYGYNASLAESLFEAALKELVAEGAYEAHAPGGTTIEIMYYWRYQRTIDQIGNYIEGYIEGPFNRAAEELGYDITIDIINEVAGSTYNACYDRMKTGRFDFAEGAITGKVLNPTDFMSIVSSTTALNAGFSTNWGPRTDIVEPDNYIEYQDVAFSFDAFYTAANGAAIVVDGLNTAPVTAQGASINEETGNIDFTLNIVPLLDDNFMNLVNVEAQYIWLMLTDASGGTSTYYQPNFMLGAVSGVDDPNYGEFVWTISYRKDDLASSARSLASNESDREFTGIRVVFGVNASYSGVESLSNVMLDASFLDLGITL